VMFAVLSRNVAIEIAIEIAVSTVSTVAAVSTVSAGILTVQAEATATTAVSSGARRALSARRFAFAATVATRRRTPPPRLTSAIWRAILPLFPRLQVDHLIVSSIQSIKFNDEIVQALGSAWFVLSAAFGHAY